MIEIYSTRLASTLMRTGGQGGIGGHGGSSIDGVSPGGEGQSS